VDRTLEDEAVMATYTAHPRSEHRGNTVRLHGEATCRSLDRPDELRTFLHGKIELIHAGATHIGRGTYQPGWKWSESVGPIVHMSSCASLHTGYCMQGRMHLRMDDGTELEFKAGDAFLVPPGHDAWVVGDEPCVIVDTTGYGVLARPN